MVLVWWTLGTTGVTTVLYLGAYALSRYREPWDKSGAANAWSWAGEFYTILIRLVIAWVMIWAMVGVRSVVDAP